MDVITAFQNGDLEKQLEEYVPPGKDYLVCQLKKSLYGLKQAPQFWNIKFVDYMTSIGFQQSEADPYFFIPGVENGFCALECG